MVESTAAVSTSTRQPRSSFETALTAARVAAENRGRDIQILDLRKLTSVFDFFVIVTGTSRRQLHAMSEEIDRVLEKEEGDQRYSIEGFRESRWILLDYGDVVIHLFDEETRKYYALEDLWCDGVRYPFELGKTPVVPAPANIPAAGQQPAT